MPPSLPCKKSSFILLVRSKILEEKCIQWTFDKRKNHFFRRFFAELLLITLIWRKKNYFQCFFHERILFILLCLWMCVCEPKIIPWDYTTARNRGEDSYIYISIRRNVHHSTDVRNSKEKKRNYYCFDSCRSVWESENLYAASHNKRSYVLRQTRMSNRNIRTTNIE